MKIKKFGLAMLPLAATGAAIPMVVSCKNDKSESTVKTMGYDDAKAWVKANYGETAGNKVVASKVTSSWDFSGELTWWKSVPSTCTDYFKNHFTNLIKNLGYITNTDKITNIKKTFEADFKESDLTYTAKSETAFENDDIKKDDYYDLLAEDTFDTIIGTFFAGSTGKRDLSFTIDTKTKILKATSTFRYIEFDETNKGYHIFKIPDCTVSFDSKGKITSVNFKFKKYADAEYIWASTAQSSYTDFFMISIDEGKEMNFTYTYDAK